MATRRISKTRAPKKQAQAPGEVGVGIATNGESSNGGFARANGSLATVEEIQRRAYELFIARGGTHGCDWADWFKAEQELRTNSAGTH